MPPFEMFSTELTKKVLSVFLIVLFINFIKFLLLFVVRLQLMLIIIIGSLEFLLQLQLGI